MKYCDKCNVDVDTSRKTCPLCFELLQEKNDEVCVPLYPEYHKKHRKYNLFLRIVSFVCISIALVTFIVNLCTIELSSTWWCLYPIISLAYVYILIRSAIISKSNPAKKLVIQTYSCSLLLGGINYLSGYEIKWSIDYAIPFMSIAAMIVIMILFLAKAIRFSDYFMYMLAQLLLGVVPMILWLFGIADVVWGCLCAACFSVVIVLGMVFFTSAEVKEELKKRFHI